MQNLRTLEKLIDSLKKADEHCHSIRTLLNRNQFPDTEDYEKIIDTLQYTQFKIGRVMQGAIDEHTLLQFGSESEEMDSLDEMLKELKNQIQQLPKDQPIHIMLLTTREDEEEEESGLQSSVTLQ